MSIRSAACWAAVFAAALVLPAIPAAHIGDYQAEGALLTAGGAEWAFLWMPDVCEGSVWTTLSVAGRGHFGMYVEIDVSTPALRCAVDSTHGERPVAAEFTIRNDAHGVDLRGKAVGGPVHTVWWASGSALGHPAAFAFRQPFTYGGWPPGFWMLPPTAAA